MRKDGLTEHEGRVMDALQAAWNEFAKLEITHTSDMTDFTNGIHQCQQILGMRVLQRDYPEGYPIKVKKLKPTHKCIDCGYTISHNKPWIIDGLRCNKCSGTVVPLSMLPKKSSPPGSENK